MDPQQLDIIQKIEESDGKLEKDKLNEMVRRDIEKGRGAFADYSSNSYAINTVFPRELSELISNGLLQEKDNQLSISESFKKVLDKFDKPIKLEEIESKVNGLVYRGDILKLLILSEIATGQDRSGTRENLIKEGWSEKAIEEGFSQLKRINLVTGYPLEFPSKETKEAILKIINRKCDRIEEENISKEIESKNFSLKKKDELKKDFRISSESISQFLSDFYEKCKSEKIEILSFDINLLKVAFNKLLYTFVYELGTLSYFGSWEGDRVFVMYNSIGKDFIKEYFRDKYSDKRKTHAFYSFEPLLKLNFTEDSLFLFFEKFLEEKMRSKFLIPPELNYFIEDKNKELEEAIERERKKLTLDEGFLYTQPNRPLGLLLKIPELLSRSDNNIKIANPYLTNTSFSFFQNVKNHVLIRLLAAPDERISDKIKRKQLTVEGIKAITNEKKVEIRISENLHSRFIIIDDKYILFLSTDLQMRSLRDKFQYCFWTNNKDIIQQTNEYFESIWKDSKEYDIFKKINEIATK